MQNQEFKALKKISSATSFWDLLLGAKGAQSYKFSRMRAHFLLCQHCYTVQTRVDLNRPLESLTVIKDFNMYIENRLNYVQRLDDIHDDMAFQLLHLPQ